MDQIPETFSELEDKRKKKLEQLNERHAKRIAIKEFQPKIDLESVSTNLASMAESLLKSNTYSNEDINNMIKEIEGFIITNDASTLKFKNLRELLDKLRQKSIVSETGKAFSFGIKQSDKANKNMMKSKMDLEEVQSKMPLCNNEIITLKNLHNESRLIQSEEDASVLINTVTDCTLKFKLCAESVSLENVRNSTIVFLPVKSSILIRNCENLTLVVAAQQIRIHDSSNLKLYVHVRGAIIIENCSEVKVAPYHINDSTSQTVLPNDIENPTFWANVQDFNWLAFHEQSPNWKKMDETEWKTFDLNIECKNV